MNKHLLTFILILCISPAFAQRFSQYNTGTLYDSFENPAQRSFIPDSSRYYASNFLIPTAGFNGLITGNAQSALLQRFFFHNYNVTDSSRLNPNMAKGNHILVNSNVYEFMYKVFTSFNGDQEIGISAQTRAEGRGYTPDQMVSLISGVGNFSDGVIYNNALNVSGYFQAYNSLGFSYRERVNKQFAIGFKVNALMGVAYNKLQVDHSSFTYNSEKPSTIAMQGILYSSYIPGKLAKSDLVPNFRNPGASISIGTMLRTRDGFVLQWNVKDLGFIHWSPRSQVYTFNKSREVNFDVNKREDSVYHALNTIVQTSAYATLGSFNTAVDGRAEFSAARTFTISDDDYMKYTPSLILSKQLFGQGMEGALVNHLQYHNAVFTLTGSYNDVRTLRLGTQFMIKSPNVDLFIGSDALMQTAYSAMGAAKNEDAINRNTPYSAASVYVGFSVKFGDFIEHPMNASTIPMGEKGFFKRVYDSLFKTVN